MKLLTAFLVIVISLIIGVNAFCQDGRLSYKDPSIIDRWAWAHVDQIINYRVNTNAVGYRQARDLKLSLYECDGTFLCNAWAIDILDNVWWNGRQENKWVQNERHLNYIIEHCGNPPQHSPGNSTPPPAPPGQDPRQYSVPERSRHYDNYPVDVAHPSGIRLGIGGVGGSSYKWKSGGFSAGLRLESFKVPVFLALDMSYDSYEGDIDNPYDKISFINIDPIMGLCTSRQSKVFWNIIEVGTLGFAVGSVTRNGSTESNIGYQWTVGTSLGINMQNRSALILGVQSKLNFAMGDIAPARTVFYGRISLF